MKPIRKLELELSGTFAFDVPVKTDVAAKAAAEVLRNPRRLDCFCAIFNNSRTWSLRKKSYRKPRQFSTLSLASLKLKVKTVCSLTPPTQLKNNSPELTTVTIVQFRPRDVPDLPPVPQKSFSKKPARKLQNTKVPANPRLLPSQHIEPAANQTQTIPPAYPHAVDEGQSFVQDSRVTVPLRCNRNVLKQAFFLCPWIYEIRH